MHRIWIFLAALLLAAGCNENDKATSATNGAETVVATTEAPATETPAAETAGAESTAAVESPSELVGQAAPDFSLPDFAGNMHSLADYTKEGKIVIVEWFDYECGATGAYYANKQFVDTMNTATKDKEDVVWLSIVSSGPGKKGYDPKGNTDYMEANGKVNPTLRDEDGKVGKAYGARSTPTVIVIDKLGKVVYAGAFDAATNPKEAGTGENYTLAAVDAVRAGKAPAVSTTKAFG